MIHPGGFASVVVSPKTGIVHWLIRQYDASVRASAGNGTAEDFWLRVNQVRKSDWFSDVPGAARPIVVCLGVDLVDLLVGLDEVSHLVDIEDFCVCPIESLIVEPGQAPMTQDETLIFLDVPYKQREELTPETLGRAFMRIRARDWTPSRQISLPLDGLEDNNEQ